MTQGSETLEQKMPEHIAIIMDGNNRWAKKRVLGGISGHKAGADSVREVVASCRRLGVKSLTLYAFSSENWKRPQEEVNGLMDLFLWALKKEVKKLHKNDIRLKIIGDVSAFSDKLQASIRESEALTANNQSMTLNVAANYGGRWDIGQAAKKLCELVQSGDLTLDEVNEQQLDRFISMHDQPQVDLLIRTAGEQRISNFLLWQCAYSEFWYTDVLWPDFREPHLLEAIDAFNGRERRFGGR